MLKDFPGAPFIAFGLALVPALMRWWWGRPLERSADDPVLPERLLAHNTRVSAVAATCAAVQVAAFWPMMMWALPVQILASTAAAYPLRKTVYNETWTFGGFLAFFTRLMFAIFGFWILLIATPLMTSRAGGHDLVAGCALSVILGLWSWHYGAITRAILGARPVDDPSLLDRFEAVVRRSRAPMPRFEYVAVPGGVFANALALPTLRGSSVLFTDTLLQRLTPDEIVAICGHEIAHLEYYDRARLRRIRAANFFLIALAALLTPLSRLIFSASEYGFAVMVFPLALVGALIIRARHRQRHETESDLRAVELTGDAEALASGLTALHTIARMPRRWDQRREQQATHPSLARRLRDIRAAAGTTSTPLHTSPDFRDAIGTGSVTFEPSRLRWQEGLSTTHFLDYSTLSELRLHASPGGAVTLVAVQGGRRWEMTPAAADRAAVQSMLDAVDGQLCHEAPRTVFSAALARVVIAMGGLLMLLGSQIAVAIVALLAAVSATPTLLNAAGAAALVAGAVILRDGDATAAAASLPIAILVAFVGAAFFAIARARRNETSRTDVPFMLVLAAAALISLAIVALGGVNPIRLHQGARTWPAAAVLLVALAAASWSRRQRTVFRYTSAASALAGALVTVMGSTVFLDAAGRDPFLVTAPRATRLATGTAPQASFDVPFNIGSLRLSPSGNLIAMTRGEDDEPHSQERPPTFYVGRADGRLSRLEGNDIVFIDDSHVLLFVLGDAGAELREIALEPAPRVRWTASIQDVRSGTLTYHSTGNRWSLLGRDGRNRLLRAEGTVGATGMTTTEWTGVTSSRGTWIDAFATDGAAALVVERHYERSIATGAPWLAILPPIVRSYPETRLARVEHGTRVDAGLSLLDTSCAVGSMTAERVVCTAYDGTRTRIVAIHPATAAVTPLALLEGRFWNADAVVDGWLSGWWESAPAAIRLSTHDVVRPPPVSGEFIESVTANDLMVATVSPLDEGSRVRLYPLRAANVTARRGE